MIPLSEAKEKVMDAHYFKNLEIFEILENGSDYIFIINGVADSGKVLIPQPFVRLLDKETGEIKPLIYTKDFDFISTHYVTYRRKMTLKESIYYIGLCFSHYNISSVYESENYHKFVLRHQVLDIKTIVLLDRNTRKIVEDTKDLLKDEKFIEVEKNAEN